ncbi:MAG: HAD family phosphatase [Treponema sp.]|nr:HAD family phosphatase [Treponema sp.]
MDETAKFRPAGAIFDMDGLMLDTERPIIPLWQKAAQSFGWDVPQEMKLRAIGRNGDDIRAMFMAEYGSNFPYEGIRQELNRLTSEQFEKGIPCKPGLRALLDHLAFLGVPLAVATSTGRDRALWKLRIAGILDRFAVFACGDEVRQGKPAPDVFLLAAQRLGKPPSACVGFEDSPAGLQGLCAAGIRSVFVKDLLEPPPEVLAAVWRRCGDLGEAVELFG